ncbi:hypothetical protein CFT61_12375 [Segatella copri]|uniref:PD-(D/E)XK nuclease superfamily protein n=1 Tax=Segatella copri TaxID=165179 RepID=A0AA91YWE2_9BACT|nr:PD-(D/E)XK nuclease family protein [Segatella copri]OXL43242.1 hypothetical protein CFT61_12375 [Segatella copri]
MNEKEICELMDKIPTFEGSKSIYNPMETFVEYVSQKEICHSSILAELLNPLGRHGLGRSFLDAFLKEIECNETFEDVTIQTEMPVQRILTDGSGPRRIDICIINNYNNDVVIIENKLNNAKEQYRQLEDYEAGSNYKGFNVVKTVCLQGSNPNDIGADIDLSIMHLAELLDKVCGNCFELKSYITLLKNMGLKEKMNEEVKKLLSLDNETFDKVRDLSRLFYNDEVSEYCFNEIRSSLENMNKGFLELIFSRKDNRYFDNERSTSLQIWNQDGRKEGLNSGCWIELWFFDYSRFEIWIKGNSENCSNIDDYVLDKRWNDYYRYKDGVKSFPFPGKEWKTTMIGEISELIKKLYTSI